MFWNSRYREILCYCEMQFLRKKEEFKEKVILAEALTDKLLKGDCMRKNAKIIPLKTIFKTIFQK